MSEATDNTTGEFCAVEVHHYNGPGKDLRMVTLGLNPVILIEPVEDDNGLPSSKVSLSLIDPHEAAELLRIIADALDGGQEVAE